MKSPVSESRSLAAPRSARVHCLIVERDGGGERQRSEVIEVPGLTTLSIVDHLISVAPGGRAGTLLLEPLLDGPKPMLVVSVVHPLERVQVNGAQIGRTHALAIGDVVTCDGGDVRLHVSMRYRPHIGAPHDEHLGRTCPVCLTTVDGRRSDGRETSVIVCCTCQAVLHEVGWIGDEAAAEKLECSRTVSNCPVCGAALVREEQMAYVPQL